MEPTPSRRALLRSGSALAATATIAGVSGCLDGLLGSGAGNGQHAIGRIEQWAPAQDEIPGLREPEASGVELNSIGYTDPAGLVEIEEKTNESIDAPFRNRFEPVLGQFDVDDEDVRWWMRFYFGTQVIEWHHDPETVVSTLRSEGFEAHDQRGDFRVLTGDPKGRDDGELNHSFAFDGSYVVRSTWSEENVSEPRIDAVLDARTGSADRLAEANDAVAALTAAAKTGDVVSLEWFDSLEANPPSGDYMLFEEQVARCMSGRVNGDRFDFQHVLAFEDSAAVDRDAITEHVNESLEAEGPEGARNVLIETDGRIVVVTYDVALEAFFGTD